MTELDIVAWLTQHSVRFLARYFRVHCPALNDTSFIVLPAVGTTSREPRVGLEPPGEERMTRQLKEFDNEPRWESACISYHVEAFDEIRNVLLGCDLRKRRQ